MTIRQAILVGLGTLSLTATGCDKPNDGGNTARTAVNQDEAVALPAGLFLNKAPTGASDIAAVKTDVKAQGNIVVSGRIGGRAKPFVDGAAVFLLADLGMKPCNELHGDRCKTPWDYCCEPRDSLTAKTATIQVIGSDGKPLRLGLEGRHGLHPLAKLTIAGEIVPRDDVGTLVIIARGIHAAPSGD